jgi:hypothetical protein
MPFHGKATPPTAAPSAEERRANIEARQKERRRKGFLIGLIVGQLLIIGIDLGGRLALKLLKNRVQLNAPVTLEALVFFGMSAGIVITMLLILLVLGLQGTGWLFGKKKVGFFTALGRGLRRVWKAAWALGLTLGVIGGTGWFMIPKDQWWPTWKYAEGEGRRVYEKGKGWVKEKLGPAPKTDSP